MPQAKQEYIGIAEEVFSMNRYLKQSTFDAKKLEEAVKRLLGNSRSEEKMVEKNGRCKVYVVRDLLYKRMTYVFLRFV